MDPYEVLGVPKTASPASTQLFPPAAIAVRVSKANGKTAREMSSGCKIAPTPELGYNIRNFRRLGPCSPGNLIHLKFL
jgi:hypothetical protein